MKKLVSVLFALLLIGSLAFAQDAAKPSVNVGAWGRLMFVPASNVAGDLTDALDLLGKDSDPLAFTGPGWGAGGMNVGFAVSASSDHVGSAVDLDVGGGSGLSFGDQSKAWIKINDMAKLQFGMIQGDVLRGKIGDSGFLGAISDLSIVADDTTTKTVDETVKAPYVVKATGEDTIFQRFYPKGGILLDLTPAEGVYIGAALDAGATGSVKTENMMKSVQIGAGYVIPNIGHIRAQYIGNIDEKANLAGVMVDQPKYFNAAFAYTAIEGLLVDAGLKYQFVSDVGKSDAAVSATYKKDALSAVVRAAVFFGSAKDAGGNDKLGYKASADVGYVVADPLAIGGEVAYQKDDDPMGITVAPYVKLAYANGFLKTGFAYSMFKDTDPDYSAWVIPVMMQYNF